MEAGDVVITAHVGAQAVVYAPMGGVVDTGAALRGLGGTHGTPLEPPIEYLTAGAATGSGK